MFVRKWLWEGVKCRSSVRKLWSFWAHLVSYLQWLGICLADKMHIVYHFIHFKIEEVINKKSVFASFDLVGLCLSYMEVRIFPAKQNICMKTL